MKPTLITKKKLDKTDQPVSVKVAIYTRVSTDKEEQETSLEFQRSLKEKIEQNPSTVVVGIYEDKGFSGRSDDRPQFRKLRADAKNKKFDWVVAKNISRFTRNLKDFSVYTKEFLTNGVYVHFIEEGLSTNDPSTELVLHILSCIAQQESTNTGRHIQTVIQAKHKKGQIAIKSKAPLGYDFIKVPDYENGGEKWSYKKNKDCVIVQDIFQWCIEGYGLRRISKKIEEKYNRKVPTTGGEKWSYKKNKDCVIVQDIFQWCIEGYGLRRISKKIEEKYNRKVPTTSLDYILKNRVYAGDLILGKSYVVQGTDGKVRHTIDFDKPEEYDGEAWLIENNHIEEAIVSKEDFELAQKCSKNHKDKYKNSIPKNENKDWSAQKCSKNHKDKYKNSIPKNENKDWSGKILCGRCGGTYWGRKNTYLQCQNLEPRDKWKPKCENKYLLRTDGMNRALTECSKLLQFDAQTQKEHYTDQQLSFLKNTPVILPEHIETGKFDFNEDQNTQTLVLFLVSGITLTFVMPLHSASVENYKILIETGV